MLKRVRLQNSGSEWLKDRWEKRVYLWYVNTLLLWLEKGKGWSPPPPAWNFIDKHFLGEGGHTYLGKTNIQTKSVLQANLWWQARKLCFRDVMYRGLLMPWNACSRHAIVERMLSKTKIGNCIQFVLRTFRTLVRCSNLLAIRRQHLSLNSVQLSKTNFPKTILKSLKQT